MRRLVATALTLLVAVFIPSACGDDEPKSAERPTPSASPSRSSSAPTEKPTKPVLPPEAKKATEAGARAFVFYYWDLINYAQATGDVRRLKKVSGPACEFCKSGIDGIKETYDGGGSIEGGAYTVDVTKVNRFRGVPDAYGFEILLKVDPTRQIIRDAAGKETVSNPTPSKIAVAVLWTKEAWRLDVMETY